MSAYLKFVVLLILCANLSSGLQAQDTLITQKARPLSALINDNSPKIDSARLLTYSLDNINKKDSFRIKGLDKYFHQYDPARHRDFDYGHLGNMGSAAYPTVLKQRLVKGFSLGYTQYDLYHKTQNDIIFFDQVRPFSELFFSGGETQADLRVKALFSRSFANDVNWVIDYDRISQDGIYPNQSVKQTSFLSSLSYKNDKRLSAFLSYIINASAEEINGGVQNIATLDSNIYQIRSAVPVLSDDAESRLQNQQFIFNAFYRLGVDSVRSDFTNSIQYQVQTFNEFFRFTDATTTDDSLLYKNYWVSERGIRNYNDLSRIRNGVYINSDLKNVFHFKAGAFYDYNNYGISEERNVLNEVFLSANGTLQFKNRLNITADFYYGLLDAANEFGLDAHANLKLTKQQGFNFGFIASRFRVNLVQEEAVLNQSIFYNEDISPIILQTLSAEYYHHLLKMKIGGKIENTFNFLYFDQFSLPKQEPGLYSVSLIYASFDLKYKKILLENFLYVQRANKNLVNLPEAFTKNSLSFYGRIFKDKMLLKAGLDFRYIVSDYVPYFNPVIGQFYLNEEVTNKPYPLADVRVSFKVSSFTTFLKYENIGSFLREDVDQLVVGYPQFDARFRFGIQWNLWN